MKFNLLMIAYVVLLFVLLTPNVLVVLPPNGSFKAVVATHALLFGLIWVLTHHWVWENTQGKLTLTL